MHGFLDVVPVGGAHHDARAEPVLHQLGAADVIAVSVRDDDVFDGSRIEAELAHAADDRLIGRVVVERVDQDDALARRQRPGRVELGADEIEIVEHFRRLGEPGRAGGRRGRRDVGAGRGLRRDADARQRPGEIEPSRRLGRRKVGLDAVRRRLCQRRAGAQSDTQRQRSTAFARVNLLIARLPIIIQGLCPARVNRRHPCGQATSCTDAAQRPRIAPPLDRHRCGSVPAAPERRRGSSDEIVPHSDRRQRYRRAGFSRRRSPQRGRSRAT